MFNSSVSSPSSRWWPRANRCAPICWRVRVQDAAAEAASSTCVASTAYLRRRRLLGAVHHNTIRVLLDQIEGDAEAAHPVSERNRVVAGLFLVEVHGSKIKGVLAEQSARAQLPQVYQRVTVLCRRCGDGDGLAGLYHLVVAHALAQALPAAATRALAGPRPRSVSRRPGPCGIAMPAVLAITHTAVSQRIVRSSQTIYLSRVCPRAARALQVRPCQSTAFVRRAALLKLQSGAASAISLSVHASRIRLPSCRSAEMRC